MTRAWLAPLAVVGVLLLGGFNREEVGTSSICVYWPTRAPHFSVNARGSTHLAGQDQFTAIQQVFAEWATPFCTDLSAVDDGLTPRFDLTYNPDAGTSDPNVNLIVWRSALCSRVVPDGGTCKGSSSCDDQYDCLDDGDQEAIALTTVFANSSTGAILGAGTELNDAKFVFTTVNSPICNQNCVGLGPDAGCGPPPPPPTAVDWPCVEYDLQEVMTIEVGHLLGFAASSAQGAILATQATLGDTSERALGTDDQAAVCAVYPSGKSSPPCDAGGPLPGPGCGCAPSSAPGRPGAWLPLLLCSVFFGWLLRRWTKPQPAQKP